MITIYVEKNEPIEQAVEKMTDSWLEGGQYCEQTLFDMREAIKTLLAKNAALQTENKELEERACFATGALVTIHNKLKPCGLKKTTNVLQEVIETLKNGPTKAELGKGEG